MLMMFVDIAYMIRYGGDDATSLNVGFSPNIAVYVSKPTSENDLFSCSFGC